MKKNIALGAIICILLAFYGCEREVSFTESEEPSYEYFQLEVNSNPQGAKVYFGDKATGYTTPCKIKYVEAGYHALNLRLDLFLDGLIGVHGDNGEKVSKYYSFFSDSRNMGRIYCTSTPTGANIFLNGNKTGYKTPSYLYNLWPGKYKISFQVKNCRMDSLETTVRASETSAAVITLADTSVFVDYTRETKTTYGSSVLADKKGRIWYGTFFEGLFVYENRRFENFTGNNSPLPTSSVSLIFEDSRGNIWVSTTGGLARISAGKEWTVFNNRNSPLPANQITGICEDQNQNIWISSGKALLKLSSGEWEIYTSSNSPIPNNEVTSVGCSTDNSIWITVNNSGAFRFKNNMWTEYSSSNSGLSSNYLNAICTGDNNIVYALSAEEIFKFSGGVWSRVNTNYGRSINGYYLEPDGTLWIAPDYGFAYIKPDGKTGIIYINSVPNVSNITCKGFAKDSEKNIWIASYKLGLVKYKYGK